MRIARDELARARDDVERSGQGRLLLNVDTAVDLNVVVERTETTAWGYSLSGRIEGGTVGFVTLVVHPQAVSASIWTPDASYEVVPVAGGLHALRRATNEPTLECAGTVHPELAGADETAHGGVDDGSVVDILVVWTPAHENSVGGEQNVKSQIDSAVAYTNDAFERSGAFVSLNLVGAEMVDYEEVNVQVDLNRLVDPADGHMDRVHTLRDTLGADLVNLAALYLAGFAGQAQLGGSFSVAVPYGPYFAHEVGHNMWLQHDQFQGGPQGSWRGVVDGDLGVGGFGYGFVGRPISARSCITTIMSYPNRCDALGVLRQSVPFFSSPWAYNPADGRPLGVSRFSKERGQDGPADAVLMVNRLRHQVANRRQGRSTTD